jgi:L-rhamnose isomerase
LLEPSVTLEALERNGDFTGRLALFEEVKGLPFGAVWDYHCLQNNVPVGYAFMDDIRAYEREELAGRA